MTIDEAIKREKETAADFRSRAGRFRTVENSKMSIKYAEEHEQIAKWLDELKYYKDENIITVHLSPDSEEVEKWIQNAREETIEEFYNEIKKEAKWAMAINSIIPAKIVEVSQVIDIKGRLKKKYLKGAE
jgi:hypothetical protein